MNIVTTSFSADPICPFPSTAAALPLVPGLVVKLSCAII